MIARGFKSVIWVATVGGAALCCYMVSLRVATERADLAKVEGQIVAAKRELRSLQTELGTRGRLTQLEQWNSDVLALAAPTSAQFVKDQVTLARLERHDRTVEEQGTNIRMASAEVPAAPAAQAASPPAARPEPGPKLLHAIAPAPSQPPLVRRASYTPAAESSAKPATAATAAAKPVKDPPATTPRKGNAVAAATAASTPPSTKPVAKPSAPNAVTASVDGERKPGRAAAKPPAPAASRMPKAPSGEGHR
jgi:hypothetical protein